MKSKTHKVVVSIHFDKKILRSQAVKEFADCIHGVHYPGHYSEAGEFKIKSTKSAKGQ